jgi:hypothetical protein
MKINDTLLMFWKLDARCSFVLLTLKWRLTTRSAAQ